MISKVTFKNYKLFKERQVLDLKPITIIIGKNNSGKSAILKLMTVIEGALKAKSNSVVNLINDEVQAGNEYKDLVYGKFGRALEIELFQKKTGEDLDDILSFEVAIDINKNIPILDFWNLNDEIKFRNIENNIYENELDGEEYYCEFLGISLMKYLKNGSDKREGKPLPPPHFMATDFIGAIREKTKQDYRLNVSSQVKSHFDGRYLYDFLIRDYLSTDKKYFTKISQWIKEKFEGWELYIDVDSEPYHIELRKGKLETNITETGMGIGQSLPLITRAYKPCEEETLIIVEEPECHLHPYAHAQLAQLFAESIKEDINKKYLFETHSQNFILRLRRLVAEGMLNESDLGIYYVEFDEESNESNLREIKVDKFGNVNFWPEGIFSETLEETIGIRTAQIEMNNVGRN
ncbi:MULTISPECIES: DUF3696 domain-containing protein [Emticicia]|uniref:AAA family ATPase n=1 Tax=Emticicia TaxID=312278 RepID=UPI0007D8C897|nr:MULTISPECIES: DUF3696 domain-containing protein [Emticicia]